MTKEQVQTRIEEIGIIPAIRVSSGEEALFAAEALLSGGIRVIELTMTTPGALEVIARLARTSPDLVVGAGTVLDTQTAEACVDAGASFITSPALDLDIVDFDARKGVLVIPGALTPTEIVAAMKAGMHLIKVFPCSLIGGASYIRALKAPFPQVALIASGGVNQQTAGDFIRAGSAALGIGEDLVPHEAVRRHNSDWIRELARRFMTIVHEARHLGTR